MKVYTWDKVVSSVVNDELVEALTFAGLGTSNQGVSPTFVDPPNIFIENAGERRLYAKNRTVSGFDLYGAGLGEDPPYTIQVWAIDRSGIDESQSGTSVSDLIEDIVHRLGKESMGMHGVRYILRALNRIYKQVNDELAIIEREWFCHFANGDISIDYSSKSLSFTNGATLTGGTSGATATILMVKDDEDNTGTLVLKNVSGTFQNAETLTDSEGGTATAASSPASAKSIAIPNDMLYPFRISDYKHYREPEIYSVNEVNSFTIINRRLYISDADLTSSFQVHYYAKGKTLVEEVSDSETETAYPEWPEQYRQYLLYATCVDLSAEYPMYKADLVKSQKLRYALARIKSRKQEASPDAYNPYNEQNKPVNRDDYAISEDLQ